MVREQSRRRFLQLAAAGATSVGISSVASRKSRAVPAIEGPSVIGQTGTIVASHSTPGQWQRVNFETPFALTPVVIMQPVGTRDSVPVSIRKVTRRGFEFTFTGQNGYRKDEPARVSYLAVARGVHELSGSLINAEAGFVAADTSLQTVSFDHSFAERPIVFAQSQTHSHQGAAAGSEQSITPQIDVTGSDQFSVRLQARGQHQRFKQSETVGYLAFEPGSGVLDPPMGASNQLLGRFEIATAQKSVMDPWHQLVFEHTYDQPILLAGVQTSPDAVSTRVANLNSENAAIRPAHEPNTDASDIPEHIGYAVFENEHLLYV
ncbi:twin-arginine translocation signal domain-containing protein [Halocatena salina]|uniref:Twin-arginine translocation signal domain-containing protein n=1 Tax=Halocatena salina TaxID=2934340 RepID=A0A8U0A2X9_9EURY|nr:twin-arginine translocation signal domain-containing protein [Halocatena salina]UPM43149.1 twin-arginine translocation signal domain-containing protein [Halocatena salina]